MDAKEYIVSLFAILMLVFFCSPIFALGFGILNTVAPSNILLKLFVGLTRDDVINAIHSLVVPLVGAVIIFRAAYFGRVFGIIILAIISLSIISGFFVYMMINPIIFGNEPRFRPYIIEYPGAHNSIFNMISMLIVLFLAKLGIDTSTAEKEKNNGRAAK